MKYKHNRLSSWLRWPHLVYSKTARCHYIQLCDCDLTSERDLEKRGTAHQTSCEVWRLDHGYDACICERADGTGEGR